MTRFANPNDVLVWAEEVARGDIERNRKVHYDEDGTPYQIDLNPYSTQGARNDWQRGFDNALARTWEEFTRAYDTMFQRGRVAARLFEEEKKS